VPLSSDPELLDLERAFISARLPHSSIDQIMATSGKAISPKMTYALVLVIFADYELFPAIGGCSESSDGQRFSPQTTH
jgi:hypothetical protein